MNLAQMSNDEIMQQLTSIRAEGHRLLARLLVVLIEVEERRMDLEAACPSMFEFCQRKLGMSAGEAFRRLHAARLVKRFPELLGRIERGELHLSALQIMGNHLTEENVEELAVAASRKTKREVEEIVAQLSPRTTEPERRVTPLPPPTYEVRFTASATLRAKLERATDLMRHANPSGDVGVVVERALDLLIAKLEKERLGKTERPRKQARAAKPGRAARAVRREVFARDGEQCTFVSEAGEQCPARTLLELDHVEPRALGGADDAANLRVRCRAHNRLHAERIFGRERVARAIYFRQRKYAGGSDAETFSVALRGLTNMGFRATDARRALTTVMARHSAGAEVPPLQDLVRDALSELG
jgi:5-methylcytosine-specific restriction endonuclease McrA